MFEMKKVKKEFVSGVFKNHIIKAVDDASFKIKEGETVGIVGESGCGKSTVARIADNIEMPTSGEVVFDGKNIFQMNSREKKNYRKDVQIIFQNPQQAFNPRMKLYDIIAEPLKIYKLAADRDEEFEKVHEAMSQMGLTEDILKRFPHEISGGQAQRIAIIRILMLNPRMIIADEPTSMLDVSVQAQILKNFQQVIREKNIALMFISHDLDVVTALCDEMIIMNKGKICEKNSTYEILNNPQHEYTKFLVSRSEDSALSFIPVSRSS